MAMSSLAKVKVSALKLRKRDRAHLAHDLLLSLEDRPPHPDADALWAKEIGRRAREVLDGKVDLVDAEQVHAETRALLKSMRSKRSR
jgi:hypothetical protein